MNSPTLIKKQLHKSLNIALEELGQYKTFSLLNYPDHYNVGDHLIWLGAIFYFTDVLKNVPSYIASVESFSEDEMDEKAGCSPIVFLGGGNLGDLWYYYQNFYEKIISKYHNRPIIFLPQSIYFRNENKLNKSKEIFKESLELFLKKAFLAF